MSEDRSNSADGLGAAGQYPSPSGVVGAAESHALGRPRFDPSSVVARYRPEMLRLARRICYARGPLEPEDIVQDASLVILRSLDAYRGDGKLQTWVLGIVYRCALSAIRRERYSHDIGGDPSDPVVSPPAIDPLARRRILAAEISTTTADAIRRWAVGELDSESARLLGVPSATIRTRRFYGLAQLRRAVAAGVS